MMYKNANRYNIIDSKEWNVKDQQVSNGYFQKSYYEGG